MAEPAVVFREIPCADGKKIAHATLNAEQSLNSLSLEMVDQTIIGLGKLCMR